MIYNLKLFYKNLSFKNFINKFNLFIIFKILKFNGKLIKLIFFNSNSIYKKYFSELFDIEHKTYFFLCIKCLINLLKMKFSFKILFILKY